MAHCPFEKLEDLEDIFAELRKLPSLKEPKPGIFYLKAKSFLHFHTDGKRRWADIRDGEKWGTEVEVSFSASKKLKNGRSRSNEPREIDPKQTYFTTTPALTSVLPAKLVISMR